MLTLLHNWKREQKAKQAQTDQIPALIDNNSTNNNSTFIPVSIQPNPNHEQSNDHSTVNSSVLTGIELQIPRLQEFLCKPKNRPKLAIS